MHRHFQHKKIYLYINMSQKGQICISMFVFLITDSDSYGEINTC